MEAPNRSEEVRCKTDKKTKRRNDRQSIIMTADKKMN